MATTTVTSTEPSIHNEPAKPPRVDSRFTTLKGEFTNPKRKSPAIASNKRLKTALAIELARTAEQQQAELKQYTISHRATDGRPLAQPNVLANNGTLPIDLASEIVYAGRFRIGVPGDTEYTLKAHLDSSASERWEDPVYRSCFAENLLGSQWRRALGLEKFNTEEEGLTKGQRRLEKWRIRK
ncbi:hypothetical protein BJX64DRAFT_290605 [Aspergillus heterothallicus]